MTRMIRIGLIGVVLLVFAAGIGQARPEAKTFTLKNGMAVIYQRAIGSDIVTLDLVVPGTSFRQTPETAGIEEMTFSLLTHGTNTMDKTAFNRRLDKMGVKMGAAVDKDASSFSMSCVRPFFNETLALFAEAWNEPVFAPEEVELVRGQMLAGIKAKYDDPDSLLGLLMNAQFYQGHPYANDTDGTLESVAALTPAAVAAHHSLLRKQRDAFLVVVGELDDATIEEKLNGAFGKQELLLSNRATMPAFQLAPREVFINDAKLPTTYILAKFPAPAPAEAEYPALKLALKMLSSRLWEAVRTEHGLAYAVSSGLSKNLTNYGYFYLSSLDPKAAMEIVYAEIERLKSEPVTEADLKAAKAVFDTEYYMSVESQGAQAGSLADGRIYYGDYKKRDDLVKAVRELTAADIQKAASTWLGKMTFAILGDAEKIDASMFVPAQPATAAAPSDEATAE